MGRVKFRVREICMEPAESKKKEVAVQEDDSKTDFNSFENINHLAADFQSAFKP
jgi:hypothetical protein